MPHYEIFHTTPLARSQRTQLASAITNLYCTTFSAPSIFVNITFHYYDAEKAEEKGHVKHTNSISAHLRPRENSRPKYLDIINSLSNLWNDIVKPEEPGWLFDPKALDKVFIMGDIDAGVEQGFVLPVAGPDGDGKWLEDNMEAFKRRADAGDESMRRLVEDVG
ncbi:hypothetical protein CC80DRAFT_426068 [Byssothecium circinans]|uniref:Tautomerase cis-CaaD-like domain-containing protein n=1 Tax=Byssothecium circinans TaxID=147558 RepID=A0A6A5T7H2_9PLEO|nr:hypothetical protein CC80DRAFT_430516 [Byssothecium circinans]KAF1950862.1 hypothetical protein CC80DRAFT_426068 [Byssothecium circinans]